MQPAKWLLLSSAFEDSPDSQETGFGRCGPGCNILFAVDVEGKKIKGNGQREFVHMLVAASHGR
jgi:hypothetical protein